MGEVWLAEDTRLKRKVALKLLPAELTADAERVRRFEQEAQAASALNHPNIITIYDIGEAEAGRFIVMEFVEGRTLRRLIGEDLTLDALAQLGGQMARALSVAHAVGITHRDIKPENIMLRHDGYVKILDFGLARLIPATANDSQADTIARQTRPGALLGTVAYMSPEQARGEAVSQASDIFALGIVLYEMATKRHPFKAETLVGYLHAITSQRPAPPTGLNSRIPLALEALILRMLDKDENRRPTADEVARRLQEIEGQRDRGAEGQGNRELEGEKDGETFILHLMPSTPVPSSPIHHNTVGRSKERHELRAAFNAANTGRGSLLCVAGEPGIGKTTVVEGFLAELAREGLCMIARGRCSERLAGTEAYLPLLEALDSLLRDDARHAAPMRQLAPTWYGQVASLSGEGSDAQKLLAEVKAASQERVKRELAAFLRSIAQARPLVIFFDDLHWADVSTIDLLSYLAGKFDTLRVLIVVAYRPSDMLLVKHPFLQIKPDLQARGVCRELTLEFLTEAEVAEYLKLEFPNHRFPNQFPKLIHAKTEGSPLFMADLTRYLRDRGMIANTSGVWALKQTLPDMERELPESVRGMIERKIAQLGEDDRKLLTAASVQGYEFDSAVVAQALQLDAVEVEERLDKLDKVLAFVKLASEAEFPNGALTLKYRFVHVLYQNSLYLGLRATRKATLSREVAQALEGFYGPRSEGVANELALLWEVARDYARAVGFFFQAARNAVRVNAHREVVELSRRGLGALLKLPEGPERDRQELGLQLTLGLSLQNVVSWAAPETGAAFTRARQLCEQMGGDPRLFVALVGVVNYHLVRAEFGNAHELSVQMLPMAEQSQNPALLVAASVLAGAAPSYRGELVSSRQHLDRALALDRREYHDIYLSMANENWGISARRLHCISLWSLGYADQALALAREAVTLAEQIGHPFSLGGAHFAVGVTCVLQRDWPASQLQFEKVFAIAEEYSLGTYLNRSKIFHAMARFFQEPGREAIDEIRQGIESLRFRGEILGMTGNLARLAESLWVIGRCEEGLDAIAEAMDVAESAEERFWEAELWRVKGELLLKADDDNAQIEAENCYHKAIEIALRQNAKSWELRAVRSLARLWQRQGKRAEARQMLAEIYGWFTEGFDTADLKDAKILLDELSFG